MDNFKLEEDKISRLRDFFESAIIYKKLQNQNAWNKTCAAIDNVQFGMKYINRINWNNCDDFFAFELIDLLTGGKMIKEGVKIIHKSLFNKDYPFTKDTNIFNQVESDDKIFDAYRALSFAHSLGVDKERYFADKEKRYFAWLHWKGNSKNLVAHAARYSSSSGNNDIMFIEIEVKKAFNYIKSRYDYLDDIIIEINKKFLLPEQGI